MTDKEYPLTIANVKQFLATKKDDDIIGACWNSMFCLLSETLNWLYPEKKPWRVDLSGYSAPDVQEIALNDELYFLRCAFDLIDSRSRGPITKERLRRHLKYMEMESEGSSEELLQMPLKASDLFEVHYNNAVAYTTELQMPFETSDLFEIAKQFQISEEDIGPISTNNISSELQEKAYERL